jgi:YbbR domain-containing protein
VAGPQTLLQAVARVVAVVDVSGIDATRTFRTRVEARDARDMPMEGLKIQPASAEVRIKVARVNTKTVPVVLGDLVLPRGVSVGAVDLSPQTVALTGDPAVLARVRFVRTASVRFGVGETVARVALRLPRGVTAVGEDSVRVAVEFASIGRGHRASAPPSPPPSPEAPTPEPSEPAAEPQPSVPADAGATPASPDGEKPGPAAP